MSDTTKVLGRGDLVALAIGNVIGGGIMSLLGIAIGLTGRSIVISLFICAIMMLLASIPQMISAATCPLQGGFYTQAAVFGGEFFGGMYSFVFITYFFSASLYALSFADYVLSFVSGVNMKLIALLILAVLTIINILGIQVAAKAQYVMVIILTIALLAFAGFGLGHVQPGFFEQPGFMTNGFTGVMSAASLMSFALVGSTFIVNFSGQCKRPTKDIPFAIIVSTLVVAFLYILVAIVAAGVFPVEEVANQSLAKTALKVLPYPVYLFFMIGGAMIALVTSLNALLGWITPPIVQASEDGWFPKWLGTKNKRFGTPHVILLIIFAFASLVIITGWDLSTVANMGNFLSNCVMTIVILALIAMPKVIPNLWKKSMFHMNDKLFTLLCLIGATMTLVFCFFLAIELKRTEVIATCIYLAFCVLYPLYRTKLRPGGIHTHSVDDK